MKTSSKTKPMPQAVPAAQPRPIGLALTTAEILKRMAARHARYRRFSNERQTQELIAIGALTADGRLNWPKMDHVPLGPRE